MDSLYGLPRRNFAGGMSTHPISNDEEVHFIIVEVSVLVVVALHANMTERSGFTTHERGKDKTGPVRSQPTKRNLIDFREVAFQTPTLVANFNTRKTTGLVVFTLLLAHSEAFAQGTQTSSLADDGPVVRGLSWDMLGGGIPSSGALLQGEVGFSGAPKLAYHHPLNESLSIGALVAFDYAQHRPRSPLFSTLVAAVPVRYRLFHNRSTTIGLRGEAGFVFGLRPFRFAFGLNLGGNAGFTFQNRFIIGGGIEMPIVFAFPNGNTSGFVRAPLLFGPVVEYHLSPPFALTVDVKAGPVFQSNIGIQFGLKAMVGVAYRL